jgi:hypothetical protein
MALHTKGAAGIALAIASAAAVGASNTFAQAPYPFKPIRIIVPMGCVMNRMYLAMYSPRAWHGWSHGNIK